MNAKSEKQAAGVSVRHLNPETMHSNPAFSQLVSVEGPVRTLYIGGQDAVDKDGTIVGVGDLKAQTKQVLLNIVAALKAGGARPEHVVKWNIYILQGQSVQEGFAAFQEVWENPGEPPAITAFCTPAPSVHTEASRTSADAGACVLVCISTPSRKYFTTPPSTAILWVAPGGEVQSAW